MFQKIGKIENLTTSGDSLDRLKNGNEEDFLNLYFPDWVSDESLHLDHGYNMIHYQLDEYNALFGFTIEDGPKPVYILHFASYFKPWQLTKEVEKELESHLEKKLELYSIKLWMKTYEEIEIK